MSKLKTAGIGHNSGEIWGAERLKQFVERIERMNEEIAELTRDRAEIFSEAKSAGFETKIIRELIKLRKMDSNDRAEYEEFLHLYKDALGMLADTPLGTAALENASKKSNTKITLTAKGMPPVETTLEKLEQAADALSAINKTKVK